MDKFISCAKAFKLHGQPMHELCDHNYKVSSIGDLLPASCYMARYL